MTRQPKEVSAESFKRGGIGFIGGILFFGAAWLAKQAVLRALSSGNAVEKEI